MVLGLQLQFLQSCAALGSLPAENMAGYPGGELARCATTVLHTYMLSARTHEGLQLSCQRAVDPLFLQACLPFRPCFPTCCRRRMQGMCAAHWQAVLAAVLASGGMSAAVAAAAATGKLPLIFDMFTALATVSSECPSVVDGRFQSLVQEACSPAPQVSATRRHHRVPTSTLPASPPCPPAYPHSLTPVPATQLLMFGTRRTVTA